MAELVTSEEESGRSSKNVSQNQKLSLMGRKKNQFGEFEDRRQFRLSVAARILATAAMIADAVVLPMIGMSLVVNFLTLWQAPRDNYNSIEPKYICECDYSANEENSNNINENSVCECDDYSENSDGRGRYPKVRHIWGWSFALLPDVAMFCYVFLVFGVVVGYVVLYITFFLFYSLFVMISKCCCSNNPRIQDRSRSIATYDRKFQMLFSCSAYQLVKAHQSFVAAGGCGLRCCAEFWSCSILDYLLVCCDGSRGKYLTWLGGRILVSGVLIAWLALYPTLKCSCPGTDGGQSGKVDYNSTWDDVLPVAQSECIAYISLLCVIILFRFGSMMIIRKMESIPARMRVFAFTYLAIPLNPHFEAA